MLFIYYAFKTPQNQPPIDNQTDAQIEQNIIKQIKSLPAQPSTTETAKTPTKTYTFTPEGIKTLSPSITDVNFTPQSKPTNTVLIDIDINKDPFTGGAQDWNSIAGDAYELSKTLLKNPNTQKIHFTFRSPDNKNIDWARFFVDRDNLPEKWQAITYLQFFSYSRPMPGTVEAGRWLCDFYGKYKSSRPYGNGETPDFCNK